MSAKELAQKFLDGLEGVTLEPWCVEDGDVWSADDGGRRGIPLLRQDASRHFRTWGRIISNDEMAAIVAFVARCSPDNIRTLAAALLAETARADSLAAEIERVRGALEPFATVCDVLFNDHCPDETPAWWSEGPDETYVPSPITVGDFRRARASTEKAAPSTGTEKRDG